MHLFKYPGELIRLQNLIELHIQIGPQMTIKKDGQKLGITRSNAKEIHAATTSRADYSHVHYVKLTLRLLTNFS